MSLFFALGRSRAASDFRKLALKRTRCILIPVSVEEIKHSIASLSSAEQGEISAFLFHLRHVSDPDYQERVSSRLSDRDAGHCLSLEEFERKFDKQ